MDPDPGREARQLDEGVCVHHPTQFGDTLTPPHSESCFAPHLVPVSAGQPFSPGHIWTYTDIIEEIWRLGPLDETYVKLVETVNSPKTRRPQPNLARYSVKDSLLYNRHRLVVPNNSALRTEICRAHHDAKPAGHPGRAKTLGLIQRSYTWPSITSMVNRYVDGCDSCLRSKASTQPPLGSLEPLPIPAGPWTDITYDMITDLPQSEGFDSILTVVDRLTKMAHFIPCRKSMNAEQLARVMLDNVWKLHGTPKTIVSDRGSVFISQVTRELGHQLGIRLLPSTAFHPRTDGQSEIANKAVEQYLRHFVSYRQDDWVPLLATAEFAHNSHDHASTGVSPFKANYGFDPTY